jgi:ApaG protein
MYKQKTHDISVSVLPLFLSESSHHEEGVYMWAYHVRIDNKGQQTVRLTKRFWRIFDAKGHLQEISGDGVLGEQPELKPGDTYEYASGATLNVPSGMIQGSYEMERDDGQCLKVDIPCFSLDSPYQVLSVN